MPYNSYVAATDHNEYIVLFFVSFIITTSKINIYVYKLHMYYLIHFFLYEVTAMHRLYDVVWNEAVKNGLYKNNLFVSTSTSV